MLSSAFERLPYSNINWLTQPCAATRYGFNLHTKVIDDIDHIGHHKPAIWIKQNQRLHTRRRLFHVRFENQTNPKLHDSFVYPSTILTCIEVVLRKGGKFSSLYPCVWFAFEEINGFKRKPDAVTVTDTVPWIVDDDEVRPLKVLSPEALRVCPEDTSKKIGVWSVLRMKRGSWFGPTIIDLAYSIKLKASLLTCSGGRWLSCVTALSCLKPRIDGSKDLLPWWTSFWMQHTVCMPWELSNAPIPWSHVLAVRRTTVVTALPIQKELKLFQNEAMSCLLLQGCFSSPSASFIVSPVMVASQNDGNITSKSHLIIVAHQFEPKKGLFSRFV